MDLPVLASSALSQVGPVREENQDAIQLPTAGQAERGYLFALADGMGGYSHGALASRLALDTLYDAVYNRGGAPGQSALRQGVERANLEVFKAAQRLDVRMGTTLTAGFIDGSTLFWAHVGDSRLYLVRQRRAVCLTDDHTPVGDLVRARVIGADKIRRHPNRSILTRSVGISLFVRPDLAQLRLENDDRLVLCSDGLWSVVEDEEFAGLAERCLDPQELAQGLLDLAIERETDDNLSAVVIHVQQLPHRSLNSNPLLGQSWNNMLQKWFPPARLPAFLNRNRKE